MPRGDMRTFWNFASADNLAFGSDSTLQLGRWIASRGWQRVLVITDRNLVAAGISSRIEGILRESGLNVSVFDGGRHEPDIRTANLAFASAQAFLPDVLVGLGGGSNLDLAKMSGILMAHGGKPEDYFGHERVPGPVAPVICIPTTAGTGSEVSHSSVLTDEINGVKVSTLSQFLRPTLAVVDPKLTLTCPPKATADSGIDALTHAIEAFTAIDHRQLDAAPGEPFPYSGKMPLGDLLAEEAIALVGKHLEHCVHQPESLPDREGMALAATLAGMAFSNCAVAVVHALEYPIGAAVHVSHGAGNGLLLPYVMEYNLASRAPQFAKIAARLGVDTGSMSEMDAAMAAVNVVRRLRSRIGIPDRLRDIGVSADQLPVFAKKSFEIKRLMRLNPRLPTESELLGILKAAF